MTGGKRREDFCNLPSFLTTLQFSTPPVLLPDRSLTPPPILTAQTQSRELPMTHAADKASAVDVVTLRRTSSDLHSCAGGSPLAPGRCSAGCVDCHSGNGGVRGGEGAGEPDGWVVLGWCSKGPATSEEDFYQAKFETNVGHLDYDVWRCAKLIVRRSNINGSTCSRDRWLLATPSAPPRFLGPCPVLPACSEEGARLRLERCRKRATRTRVTWRKRKKISAGEAGIRQTIIQLLLKRMWELSNSVNPYP